MTAPAEDRAVTIEEWRGERLSNGDEQAAHIVDQRAGQDAAEAYVLGTELVALCGFRWVPTRDPHALPLCRACVEALTGGNLAP